MTSRTHPKLLRLQGSLAADGTPTIDGIPWDDPRALAIVREAAGEDVDLVGYDGDGPQRFDVLPLSVATGRRRRGCRRRPPSLSRERVHRRRRRADRTHLGRADARAWRRARRRTPGARALRDDDVRSGHTRAGHQRAPEDLLGARRKDRARFYVLRPGRVRVGDEVRVLGHWTLARPA